MDLSPSTRTGAQTSEWFTPLRFGAILALLLLGTFPKVMLGLHSFVYRDYGVLAYPVIHYAHESFWRGELPLWNPLSNCGAPFLAQWGTMPLYPFSAFYLVFPLPWSLSLFCLGHLFLGGLGMYFLARRWTNSGFAASVAGTAFVFSGVTLSCLMWPNYTVALGWMPWVLGLTERAWREGARSIVLAALAGALQMLAGVPEIAGFTWLLVLGLWLGGGICEGSSWGARTGRLLAVVLLVAGLMAVQLLPFLDLLAHSQRDRTFATTKWALPGWGWANLLVPLFHCFETYQGPFVQQGQAFFSSCYLGAGVLGLACIGVWRAHRWRAWLLAAAALFGLVAALGEEGHLYTWMKQAVPLLGVGRYPVKFMILAAFAMPLMGAFAISWWEEGPIAKWKRDGQWFLWVGVVLLGGMAAILLFARHYPFPMDQWAATWENAIWRGVFLTAILGGIVLVRSLVSGCPRIALQAALLVLIAVDITSHTPHFNPTIPVANFAPGLWVNTRQTPPPDPRQSRVMISPQAEKVLLSSTERDLARDFTAKRLALWSNLNLLDGISKVNGSSTLQLREQQQIESLFYRNTNGGSTGLIDFLAVSHITAPESAIEWANRSNYCGLITCGQQPVFTASTNILAALAASDFDPRKTVYLPLESRIFVTVSNQSVGKILRTHFSAQRLEIEVEMEEPGLVVIAQTFYHPWRASVAGHPVPLLRANHAFQALEAPAGHSHIVLRYEDRRLWMGGVISGLSALACLIFWLRSPREIATAIPSQNHAARHCKSGVPPRSTFSGLEAPFPRHAPPHPITGRGQ